MKISKINTYQSYSKNKTSNISFERRQKMGGKTGCVIGSLAGLAMFGTMIATYPFDWRKVSTWPIMGISLTTAGAVYGKMIGETFCKKKDNNKEL